MKYFWRAYYFFKGVPHLGKTAHIIYLQRTTGKKYILITKKGLYE